MKPKNSFLLYALLWAVTTLNSQVLIQNLNLMPKLKTGITYVVMEDTVSVSAKAYMEVYRNAWQVSKLEFIKPYETDNKLDESSSFISFNGEESTSQFVTKNIKDGTEKTGISFSNTHLYLEYWKWGQVKKKNDIGLYKITMARIHLFTDFPTYKNPNLMFTADYDGGNHIRNWGIGILKNYVQLLSKQLNGTEDRRLYASETNEKALAKLKRDTLFVPDYVLIEFNKFTGNETKKHNEKDVFADYPFKYKLLSSKELNKKIMDSEKPFLYFIYVKSSTKKFISIVNAQTGELVYTNYKHGSYNISSKDFRNIAKSLDKAHKSP
jgi:hypothetical protein